MVSVAESEFKPIKLSRLPQSIEVNIPKDWLVKSLGEIADINPEIVDQSYPHKEILYVDIGSVESFRVQGYEKIRLDGRPSRAQRIVRKNDIIVSTVRPNLKAFAKIEREETNLVCSTGFAVVRPHSTEDVDFIFSFIKGHHFETNILRHMEGMAYPAITADLIRRSLIPYSPSNVERSKIASILSKVDDLIQKTDEIIEQTQRLKKGLMRRLLIKGIGHQHFRKIKFVFRTELTIPAAWKVLTIDSLLKDKNDIKTGPFGSTLKKEYFVPEGYKVYGQEHVIADNFQIGSYYIPESLFMKMKIYEAKPRDILISLVGTQGRVSVVPDDIQRGIINPRLLKVTFDQSIAIPEFMKLVLSSEFTNVQLQRLSHGLTMDILNLGLIRRIIFLIPPRSEQEKIIRVISNLENFVAHQRGSLDLLNVLKKGLMQKLLTGQLRVKV